MRRGMTLFYLFHKHLWINAFLNKINAAEKVLCFEQDVMNEQDLNQGFCAQPMCMDKFAKLSLMSQIFSKRIFCDFSFDLNLVHNLTFKS